MGKLSRIALIAVAASMLLAPAVPSASAQSRDDYRLTDRHVFQFGKLPKHFARDVAAAGGEVVSAFDAIGVAVTRGLSDEDATRLGRGTRDVVLQWVPGEFASSGVEEAGDAVGSAHNPEEALFYLLGFQWDMEIIDADDAWLGDFTGDNVRVAVVDSGIDPFHQDLAGLIDETASTAFVAYGTSSDGFCEFLAGPLPAPVPAPPVWADDRYHGTHVAGTIVSNGIGTSGVAPHTELIAVKVLDCGGAGSFSDIIGGIIHAANVGADIINMSLGVPGGIPKNLPGVGPLNAAVNKAINYANSRGALVISAAGNDGIDMQHVGNSLFTPCENGSSVCVSATGFFDQLASYSNYGNDVNVAGPGGDVEAVLAPCASQSVVLPYTFIGDCATTSYLFLAGTSMAAPHVSGVAALIDGQAAGALSPAQLRAALQQTADDLGKKGNDPAYGKGRVNACAAVGCE